MARGSARCVVLLLACLEVSCSAKSPESERAGAPSRAAARPTAPVRPPQAQPASAAPSAADVVVAEREPAAPRLFAGTALDEDALLSTLSSAPIVSLRSIGSTSTVFRTKLAAPTGAALKAATERRPRGPHAEIAAYRLARLLGLSNVPPAVSRRVPITELRAKLAAEDEARWPAIEQSLLVERDGRVLVAAIHWIDGLHDLPRFDGAPPQATLAAWLTLSSPLAEADRALAAQLGTMLAFDYLIGNWDRWSGSNVKGSADGRTAYLRDHDAAFAGRLSEPLQRRMLDPVVQSQRFSRSFYRALGRLRREDFERELAADPLAREGPIVDAAALAAMFDRRDALLSHVVAVIEEHGEAAVLVFP